MANEIRSRSNLVSGTLSVGLTSGDTTMNAAALANLPAITAANHAVIVIENEIIFVTAHTAAATSATILRAQEGTSAASHAINTAWVHGPVVSDFDSVLGYAQVTANQAGIGTVLTDLTGLTVTVTVPYAQHRIRISTYTFWSSATANNTFEITIMEGATQLQIVDAFQGSANFGCSPMGAVLVVPTAASHTYKIQGRVTAGTGTLLAATGAPCFILVEDLGPAL